jgi:hypothetical protein
LQEIIDEAERDQQRAAERRQQERRDGAC